MVDDGTGWMSLRSKIELEEKIWYVITSVQSFVCEDGTIFLASDDSFKQVVQRTDVSEELSIRPQTRVCMPQAIPNVHILSVMYVGMASRTRFIMHAGCNFGFLFLCLTALEILIERKSFN